MDMLTQLTGNRAIDRPSASWLFVIIEIYSNKLNYNITSECYHKFLTDWYRLLIFTLALQSDLEAVIEPRAWIQVCIQGVHWGPSV